jgi:hypothetical protein
VFVQVNTSGEASKYGLAPEDVPAFIQALPAFSALRVRGLMTLALFSSEAERVRQCFILLRTLRDRLRESAPAGISLDELSMGMSGDFEIAIEEGATVVRIGQAIFGARPLPDSHYWPTESTTMRSRHHENGHCHPPRLLRRHNPFMPSSGFSILGQRSLP